MRSPSAVNRLLFVVLRAQRATFAVFPAVMPSLWLSLLLLMGCYFHLHEKTRSEWGSTYARTHRPIQGGQIVVVGFRDSILGRGATSLFSENAAYCLITPLFCQEARQENFTTQFLTEIWYNSAS